MSGKKELVEQAGALVLLIGGAIVAAALAAPLLLIRIERQAR